MAVCVGIQSLVAIDVTRFLNCQPLPSLASDNQGLPHGQSIIASFLQAR